MIDALISAGGASLRRHWLAWLLGSLLVFLAFPQIDLGIANAFWFPDDGWTWGRHPLAEFVRKGLPVIVVGALVFVIILYLAGKVLKQRFLGIDGWITFYLTSSLIIGPGILTNSLFKDHWHRARPGQLSQFGGDALYTPPFFIADQCDTNCSFVSGHAAMGFWVIAFAFLVPPPWRARAIAAALAFGALVGWVRIIQGGHFFSDVLYAAALVIAVTYGLWWAILGCRKSVADEVDVIALRAMS
jgi:lipid A 4'-phosphatase